MGGASALAAICTVSVLIGWWTTRPEAALVVPHENARIPIEHVSVSGTGHHIPNGRHLWLVLHTQLGTDADTPYYPVAQISLGDGHVWQLDVGQIGDRHTVCGAKFDLQIYLVDDADPLKPALQGSPGQGKIPWRMLAHRTVRSNGSAPNVSC
jgi:hypothetical protein